MHKNTFLESTQVCGFGNERAALIFKSKNLRTYYNNYLNIAILILGAKIRISNANAKFRTPNKP